MVVVAKLVSPAGQIETPVVRVTGTCRTELGFPY